MAIPIVFCSLVFSECCTPRGWMYHPLSAPVCFFCNTSVRFYLLLKCTLLLYSNPHTLSELSVNIGTLLLNSLGILVNYKYVLTKLLHRFCGHRFCKSLHPLTKLVAQCGQLTLQIPACYFCSFLGTFTSYQGPLHGSAAKISAIVKSDFSIVLDTMP